MLPRSIHLVIAATLVAGQLPMFWATYSCSMTGQRSSHACCCSGSERCTGTDGEAPSQSSLRGTCCSVTHHRLAAPDTADLAVRGNPWRQALDDSRLTVSFYPPLPEALVLGTQAPDPRGESVCSVDGSHGPGSVPLYLAHRALLI